MAPKRSQRAGVQDLWFTNDPTTGKKTLKTKRHGRGMRFRAVWVTPDGRENTKGFRTKADAQNFLDENTAAVKTGTWVDPAKSARLFGEVAEEWLASKKASTKPKTYAGYRSILDTVVFPRWEKTAVGDITFGELQAWISGLGEAGGSARFVKRGLSASRIVQTHQCMGAVFKYAARLELVRQSPTDGIELPRKPRAGVDQTYLTHAQLRLLAGEIGERFGVLVLVLGYCGLRFGEAAALRVGSVDVHSGRINVTTSVTNVTGQGLVEGAPKTHARRSVPIPGLVLEPLTRHIESRGRTELVWPGDDPTADEPWITNGKLQWSWDAAIERCQADDAEFPAVTPHDLRHTCSIACD